MEPEKVVKGRIAETLVNELLINPAFWFDFVKTSLI
jgi:hypothetical protein